MTTFSKRHKGYAVEQGLGGSWRLLKKGELVYEDPACEDLNEDRETAEAFFDYFIDYTITSINNEVIYECKGKASYKMRMTIARLEKIYGKMNKRYGIEPIESNRVGRGFFDWCQLTDDIIESRNIIVAHDGTYSF